MKRRARSRRTPSASAAPRVIVLAAGIGSRMRSVHPKVLHRVAGRTLLEAVLSAADGVHPSRVVVVVGAGAGRERVAAALEGRDVTLAVQDPPLGTGDAARRGFEALGADGGVAPVLVLAGDTPLLRGETLRALVERQRDESLDVAFLTFTPPEPGAFGRVVRDARGNARRIVEAAVASARERRVAEVNAGVYCFAPAALSRSLSALKRNRVSGEFYLTDAIEILAARRGSVAAVPVADWREAWGVNTRRDLAAAEEMERRRGIDRALDSGVTVLDPASVRIGPAVLLEPDVVLHPFVSLEGATTLGAGCEILSFTRLLDAQVAPGAVVGPHSDVEGARIGPRARVGPFSRIRPGSEIGEDVRVGNFVETKNAILHPGVKALHLSYLGDVEIGAHANIGAGVITCNYDGEKKHRTEIGERAFIGSDTQLVAPVRVGAEAYVGSGTTVTEDVPAGALALSRTRQENKEGWVARRRRKKTE